MRTQLSLVPVLGCLAGLWFGLAGCREQRSAPAAGPEQVFSAQGVVQELKADGRTVVIRHEEITNYMAAMTMPFHVRDTNELAGIRPGDGVTFRLRVMQDASWIDRVRRTGESTVMTNRPAAEAPGTNKPAVFRLGNIPEFALTNEFGQPVRLQQFDGKAVVLTFFFTRCPIPEYCPRLTKNFQGAIQKLLATAGGPTNFHFLSVSFDPVDSPPLLRAYARQYKYDSNHWSFLTGPAEQVRELAQGFGVPISIDGAGYNHGFRTAVFDTAGRLQAFWPVGGDLTDQIVGEVTKAARAGARTPSRSTE